MKITQLFLIICLLSLIYSLNVTNLTTQTFNQTVNNHKYVMVKFYAPWCDNCKTFKPQYQKLAQLTKDNDIVIGQVDISIETNLTQRFAIQKYPTLKFFIDGQAIDCTQIKTANKIYLWIKRITESEAQKISQQQINKLKGKQSFVVYFGNDPKKIKTFDLLKFVDKSIKYYLSQSSTQRIIYYPLNKQLVEYPSINQVSIEHIQSWILFNIMPTIVPLTNKQNIQYIFYDKLTSKDVAMLFKSNDLTEKTFNKFQQICKLYYQSMKCCWVDKSMEIYDGVKTYLKSKGKSTIALTKNTLTQAYSYPYPLNDITQQSWNTFIKQISEKKHKDLASVQSDQLQCQYAKILKTQNFTSFLNQNQVVFIEFFAPANAHCADFAQQFDLMAKQVYQNQQYDFEIAAIDLRRNMPIGAQLRITQFPTFRLYLAGGYVEYKGQRNKRSILQFIDKTIKNNPIQVDSIDEVPIPSVVYYSSCKSSLQYLPSLFTRYPVYKLQSESICEIVIRTLQQQKTYPNNQNQSNLSSIAKWLTTESNPILVNMLLTQMEDKFKNALENKIHLLGFVDVDPELSISLRKTLEQYCKTSSLVCGYAKKGQQYFEDFLVWAGLSKDLLQSKLIYYNTQTFQKYIFTENIEDLSIKSIQNFVQDIQSGSINKNNKKQQSQVKKQNKQQLQSIKGKQQSSKSTNQQQL